MKSKDIEKILEFIDSKKIVYAENSAFENPPEGCKLGDEVLHSECEINEALDEIISDLYSEFSIV